MQTSEETSVANRISENGKQDADPAQQLRDAQAAIEAHNRQRVEGARNDLEALCKKWNVNLGTRQIIVNGQPSPAEVTINLL